MSVNLKLLALTFFSKKIILTKILQSSEQYYLSSCVFNLPPEYPPEEEKFICLKVREWKRIKLPDQEPTGNNRESSLFRRETNFP